MLRGNLQLSKSMSKQETKEVSLRMLIGGLVGSCSCWRLVTKVKKKEASYIHTVLQCLRLVTCEGQQAPHILINGVDVSALLFASDGRHCQCRATRGPI